VQVTGWSVESIHRSYRVALCVWSVQVPDEESQPSTEVDLFVSAEKIMVLDTGHRVSLLTVVHQQLVAYILCILDQELM